MSDVILFGTGRGAEVAYRHLIKDSPHKIRGFTIDAAYRKMDTFHGLPVVPFEEVHRHFPPDQCRMLILLGFQRMNRLRAEKYAAAKQLGYTCISYVSSGLFQAEDLQIGENCFILDNQSINLDVRIGNNVVFWSSNHVGDLTTIDDHAWLSSKVTLSGNVRVGAYSFLGIGATVSNNVTIAEGSYIGANALITRPTQANGVYLAPETKKSADDATMFLKVLESTRGV